MDDGEVLRLFLVGNQSLVADEFTDQQRQRFRQLQTDMFEVMALDPRKDHYAVRLYRDYVALTLHLGHVSPTEIQSSVLALLREYLGWEPHQMQVLGTPSTLHEYMELNQSHGRRWQLGIH